jgi:hypothetical protein
VWVSKSFLLLEARSFTLLGARLLVLGEAKLFLKGSFVMSSSAVPSSANLPNPWPFLSGGWSIVDTFHELWSYLSEYKEHQSPGGFYDVEYLELVRCYLEELKRITSLPLASLFSFCEEMIGDDPLSSTPATPALEAATELMFRMYEDFDQTLVKAALNDVFGRMP